MSVDLLYKDRPEWSDVQPTPAGDSPGDPVYISFTPSYSDMMSYFRTVLLSNEISERVFDLTTHVISVNSGFYSAWSVRRNCIVGLGKDLGEELQFIRSIADNGSKNYQLWNYRRFIVSLMKDASGEKDFTSRYFMIDPKNYHAWCHRQWAVKEFNLWEGELDFVHDLLLGEDGDVYNNSAWNHRWFIVTRGAVPDHRDLKSEEMFRECSFVMECLLSALGNESAWNYLRFLRSQQSFASERVRVNQFIKNHITSKDLDVIFAIEWTIDSVEAELSTLEKLTDSYESQLAMLKELYEKCILLDPVREFYWRYRKGKYCS